MDMYAQQHRRRSGDDSFKIADEEGHYGGLYLSHASSIHSSEIRTSQHKNKKGKVPFSPVCAHLKSVHTGEISTRKGKSYVFLSLCFSNASYAYVCAFGCAYPGLRNITIYSHLVNLPRETFFPGPGDGLELASCQTINVYPFSLKLSCFKFSRMNLHQTITNKKRTHYVSGLA